MNIRRRPNTKTTAEVYSVTYRQNGEEQTACWDADYETAKRWYDAMSQLANATDVQMTSRTMKVTYGTTKVVRVPEGEK